MLNWYKVPMGNYVAIILPLFRLYSYYVVPTDNYIKYKKEEMEKAFDVSAVDFEFDCSYNTFPTDRGARLHSRRGVERHNKSKLHVRQIIRGCLSRTS